jgi:hypothetical protein
MADEPRFALYVSSVEGRLVSRPGSPHAYLGAKIPTPEERQAKKGEPTWQPEVVVPILESEYLAFIREWDYLLASGDVAKRTEADFVAYTKALETFEAERTKRLEAEAAEAKKKAEAEAKRAEAEAKKKAADGEKPGATTQGGSS